MLTAERFANARKVLGDVVRKTPLVYSLSFSNVTGNKIYLKPENMQITGAYKLRGAYYKISRMVESERKKGLITSSAGNHAQGVAYAAQLMGAEAVIVMPKGTPLVKVNNTKSYGATIVLEGDSYDEAYSHARVLAEEKGYSFVHPFNDLDVATGQGTIAGEILDELPDTDIILVPIGGGGLAAGVSTYAKMLNPSVKIIGVEPIGAASMYASIEAGHVVSIAKVDTIADGVAVQTPGDLVFPYIRDNIDEILLVDDREIPDAFLDLTENHKMVVENAGLLPIVALKHLQVKNKKVVSILSGGNMDVITMSTLVQHGLINRGRVFTLSVLLPDRPGQLVEVAKIIAENRGNVIRLEHNQFVHINRNSAVELRITLEAFGHSHKEEILGTLAKAGYTPTLCSPKVPATLGLGGADMSFTENGEECH